MSALERVMRAYARKYPLNPAQTVIVRRELSNIIDDLRTRPRCAPVTLPEVADDTGRLAVRRSAPESIDDTEQAVRVATGRV